MTSAIKSRPRPPLRRKLAFAAIAVALGLLLLEGAARAIELCVPMTAVDVGQGFEPESRVFVPSATHPGFVETAPAKRVSFTTQEFAAAKPEGTLRIAVLGGSSVNHLESEFRVLAEHLRLAFEPRYRNVEVLNVGGLSYGSHRLVLVAREMLEYQPDLLLVYEANNEFEEVEQLHLASMETVGLQRALSHSAVVRLLREIFLRRRIAELAEEHRRRVELAGAKPAVQRAWSHHFTRSDVEERMRAFRANYAAIVAACRAKGVLLVLGTMPSNLVRPLLSEEGAHDYAAVTRLLAEGKYEEAKTLGRRILTLQNGRHQSSDLENGILRELAESEHVPLVDVEAAVTAAEPHHVPGETLFADNCHMNLAGNAVWRETVERFLVDLLR